MNNITIGIAFFSGLLSFLSPCVLPLIPGYISFLSGTSLQDLKSQNEHKKVLMKSGFFSLSFAAGFSFIFILLGASASLMGKLLSEHLNVLSKISGILIILLGLHLVGIFKIKYLNYQKQFKIGNYKPGIAGAFFIGMAFAFGWTPCVGPILAGILTLAAVEKRGILLLSSYSLGLAIPFVITGFAIGFFMKFFEKYKRFIKTGEIIAGALLIIIGFLIFTDNMAFFLKFIPPEFYEFSK